ncbi:hypothetical protein H4696_000175 [Amycolatopsis lexingtonensis]|uniref:Nucleotide exchange factor GrpE n=1 Tax=Amycolatopsis lexingtonensis TaxID=218822 RepID=A0ABR9HQ63_9PSEU|nr:hypothetical protein [Amycolatopsis lexingtonensis]MBE1493075.1 hypothetical protein [Amycolatopsis lexingtonensis]
MSQPNEQQPEIARPETEDPGRADDDLYESGEGEPADSAEEARGVGQKVIGELRERRES